MKQYITWTVNYNPLGQIMHINSQDKVNKLWKGIIKVQETGLGNTELDSRILGILEYKDYIKYETLERFILNFSEHAICIIEEAKANELLTEFYGVDEQGNQFVSAKDFMFIDSRSIEHRPL